MKKFKFGVIGAGFMSSAIINGVIKSGILVPKQILVSDVNRFALDKMEENNICVTSDNKYLADNAEYVLFAIKPQNLSEVLSSIRGCSCDKFVSIMAGIKKERIKTALGGVKVARCMPNTPCSIASGAVGIDLSDYEDKEDRQFIIGLFENLAQVVLLDESKLNAVTGVSGSSPAYFYLFLKGIIDAGVKQGLKFDDAKRLAAATMIGAGKMVLENSDKSLDELIAAVCSKGGTTIEAVKVYEDCGLNEITDRAVAACVKRSSELENL